MTKTKLIVMFVVAGLLTASAAGAAEPQTHPEETVQPQFVAYYFHSHQRCPTCIKLENLAHEAILEGFPEQIESGKLVWQTVNYAEPQNEHYVKTFQLAFGSVVLAEYDNGNLVRWENLPKVWQLVHKDRKVYFDYVQTEVNEFFTNPDKGNR